MYDAYPFVAGRRLTTLECLPALDPSTGETIGSVGCGTPQQVDDAVAAARAALPTWRGLTVRERARHLRAIGDAIRADADRLIDLEVRDTGKPISDARNDVEIASRYFEFYSGVLESFGGEVLPQGDAVLTYVLRAPYGVTAHIIPWNGPLQMIARTVAPAIAVGNCAVVKPAEEASLTPVRVAELATAAGMPDGVVNVVTGVGEVVGARLASHPGIDLVSFTGSLEVGRLIGRAAAESVVPAILELGGKSANIVFDDVDVAEVASRVTRAVLLNAGQICSAGTRLLVQDSIGDALLEQVRERFAQIRVDRGAEDPDMGPLISATQLDRVDALIKEGLGTARVVYGGGRMRPAGSEGGFYYSPTIIDGINNASPLWQEEVFGPVLTVARFSDEAEAVAMANDSPYGLAAGIWTRDIGRAHRVAGQLDVGQVYVNTYGGGPEMPFGGFKLSGIGREKGVEALRSFTQTKAVTVA